MSSDQVVETSEPAKLNGTAEMIEEDESLPLCACGCGRRVKAPGRKLHCRACVGRYSAILREEGPDLDDDTDLIEQAKRLVREVPAEARLEFFQRVVELVNAEDDLRVLLGRSLEV